MKILVATAALSIVAAPLAALADPPKPLHVVETVTVKAPLERVWETVKNFDALDKWHPALAKDELVKGVNNQPGAVRVLTIKDGPTVREELLSFDEPGHAYAYKMTDPPFPFTHYRSQLHVTSAGAGKTLVRWSGTFKRKNAADNPPEAEGDAAAVKIVTGIYQGGLGNLKKLLEN